MENLYMFAIVPPDDIAKKVHNERENFAEKYKAVKALKPPVHISMYEPFHADITFEQEALKMQVMVPKIVGDF